MVIHVVHPAIVRQQPVTAAVMMLEWMTVALCGLPSRGMTQMSDDGMATCDLCAILKEDIQVRTFRSALDESPVSLKPADTPPVWVTTGELGEGSIVI